MRASAEEYARIDLRAHSLLEGVPLHDVWVVELPGGGPGRTIEDLRPLLSLENLATINPAVRALFALRGWLGRVFGWDHDSSFQDSFVSSQEAISEIRNSTVHAFSVFALVEGTAGYTLYWAIYVRPLGSITRWYMRLIDPFRRFLIYPAALRYIRAAWERNLRPVPGTRC